MDEEPGVVLGTCAAEKGTKRWDIHEREAPLAHLERLKDAPVRVALAGNARYAYKDGVPLQAPDGKSVYPGVTRHQIGGPVESAVNADTVLANVTRIQSYMKFWAFSCQKAHEVTCFSGGTCRACHLIAGFAFQ